MPEPNAKLRFTPITIKGSNLREWRCTDCEGGWVLGLVTKAVDPPEFIFATSTPVNLTSKYQKEIIRFLDNLNASAIENEKG